MGDTSFNTNKQLSDTVEDMLSDNYKKRLYAEINQAKIRVNKLKSTISEKRLGVTDISWDAVYYMNKQIPIMLRYIDILSDRLNLAFQESEEKD